MQRKVSDRRFSTEFFAFGGKKLQKYFCPGILWALFQDPVLGTLFLYRGHLSNVGIFLFPEGAHDTQVLLYFYRAEF